MSDDPRVPTQDELERLEESARLDPARNFVTLGEAYLSLGRPRDAVEAGARGLRDDPGNLAGRLMVGKALVALHQWKQAQAELLKVVKHDKQNGDGFHLLGEVLMRRSDYERAIKVLQHAQNLDPANPAILSLLKRVRTGKAMDPPAPIPSPRPPRPSRGGRRGMPQLPVPGGRSKPPARSMETIDDEPTHVADDLSMGAGVMDEQDTDMLSLPGPAQGQGRAQPSASLDDGAIRDRLPLQSSKSTGMQATVPPAPPRQKRPSAAPPLGAVEGAKVQPRIVPAERRPDAAKESLRQSAAMGEDYLNNLLAGGLLDVSNVRVPHEEYKVYSSRSLTPSARRVFVFLFTLLFLGTVGGVSWYVYSKKQRHADVSKRLEIARTTLVSGSLDDLEKAKEQARAAIDRDKSLAEPVAVFAEVGAIEALLYQLDPQEAEWAYSAVRKGGQEGETGSRELLLAESALTLSRLYEIETPRELLAEVKAKLQAFLDKQDDGWARWLLGRAMLAAGNRSGAEQAFRQAETAPNPPLIATIERADLLLDDGNYAEARKLYEAALKKAPNHPLALIGLSLLRAETSTELSQAVDDLNVHVARVDSPRVNAYANLAFAYARYALQDYADFDKYLAKAVGVSEPRFWARVGLARLLAGDARGAADARQRIQWFNPEGSEREDDPLVTILDAELSLALGRPRAALAKVGKTEGLRGASLRGRALFDQREYGDSAGELEKALKIAPDDIQLQAWHAAAVALSAKGKERRHALKELDDLRLNAKSKVPAYLQGFVLAARGKAGDARYSLEKSVEDLTTEEPNRLAYRSHLALAQLAFDQSELDKAMAEINASLELNNVYLPTLILLGRVQVAQQIWSDAADTLGQVVTADEEGLVTWQVDLGYAEAVASEDKASKDDKKAARTAVLTAKEKGADQAELARVAEIVDPTLLEEMGLPAPKKHHR